MPQTSLMPPVKTQFLDNNGKPAAGGKVYTWMAGTSNTAKATYTDSTGETENANPVTLDTNGRAAIWLSGYYHIQAYDALGNLIADADNVSSMPNTVVSQSQWVPQNITLTFVDGDNFSTPGILTDTFDVGQRVKATVSAGDIYGTVSNSTAGGSPVVTTVTVTWDSGELDDGLSAVWTGIITPNGSAQIGATYTELAQLNGAGCTKGDFQKLHALTTSATLIDAAAYLLDPANRAIGDIITETSAGTMGAIAAAAVGNYLKSAGVGAIPQWGKLSLEDTGVAVGYRGIATSSQTDIAITTGFRPSAMFFLAPVHTATGACLSVGFSNGSTNHCVFMVIGADHYEVDEDFASCFYIRNPAGDGMRSGAVISRSSTGFTVRQEPDGSLLSTNLIYCALP